MNATAPDGLSQTDVPGPPVQRSSVASNATALTIATIAARLCGLGLAIAMGRRLGVSGYGRYGFAVALGTIIVPLADLGITSYVWREVARERGTGDAQAVHLAAVKSWLSVVALAVTVAAALAVSRHLEAAAVTIVVVASMLAGGLSNFVYAYYQGRERMSFEARWTVFAAIASSLGGVALVLSLGSLLPVVIWVLAVSTVQLGVAGWRFRQAIGSTAFRARRATVPIAWRSVVAMGLLTLFSLVYLRVDSVILGIVKDHRAVGLYTAAYAIVGAVQIIPWQISQAVTPVFARTYSGDRERFAEAWHDGLLTALLVSLPMALVTTILATGILRLPYGSSFASAGPALAILVWAAPISGINAIVAGALYAGGLERWPAMFSGVALAINLGLNAWAIPQYGIVGAAAVTVGTELAVLLAQTRLVIVRRLAPLPRLPYARLLLALSALGAVGVAARPVSVILAGVLGVAAYGLVILVTQAVGLRELRSLTSA